MERLLLDTVSPLAANPDTLFVTTFMGDMTDSDVVTTFIRLPLRSAKSLGRLLIDCCPTTSGWARVRNPTRR
jgi:hypothetical protein